MRSLLLVVALAASACGGHSPTGPSPQPPPPQPITLTVHVTATNGGQPLQGVAGELGGLQGTTNGDGGFQVQTPPGTAQRLNLSGSGIVPRSIMVAVGSTRDVSVDAISVAGFDLNFYRQLVRNGFEAPSNLQPLRRWAAAPSIYIRTVDEAGATVDARTLDATTRAIGETAALWTGGRFGIAGIERGVETRAGVAGWITVRWTLETAFCGSADVARDGGTIDLNIRAGGNCSCLGVSAVRPRTVRHELGHALGYWHTDSASDLMAGVSVLGCDALPSARERAAAAIAYSRPAGNVDPDQDPSSVVTLAPLRMP